MARNLAFELVRATEAAALASARVMGRGDDQLADEVAVEAMRNALNGIDIDGVRPIDDLCAIGPRPLLLIYGDRDADVPPGTPQAMFDAVCEGADLWIVDGAGHQNITEVAPDAYADRLLSFFEKR